VAQHPTDLADRQRHRICLHHPDIYALLLRLMAAGFVACIAVVMLFCPTAMAGWGDAFDWGGHLRLRVAAADPEAGSRLDIQDKDRLYDTAFDLRSKHQFSPSNNWELDLHYEMIGISGDTREANSLFLAWKWM
jgi:hypothetical protein